MNKFNLHFVFTALLLLLMNSFCWAANTPKDRMGFISTSKIDIDKQAYSTIKLTYPIVNKIPHSEVLNQEINRIIDDIVQTYKKNLAENQPLKPISGLPLNAHSNALEVNYKMFSATRNLISIRFSIYTFFYGSAHPLTLYQSLNFDANQGKILSLTDVFKSGDYLQFISTYSKNFLTKKLSKDAATQTEPDPEGLKPIPDNFKVWNITPKGLLITFPPYQVAAYAFGPQEVLIPYSAIKPMMQISYH